MNEYTKVVIAKYTEAHVVPEGQEVPLEVAELEEHIMENVPHPPKRCPECGSKKIDHAQCCDYEDTTSLYYDCHCKKCGWQGDIHPFEDKYYYRRQGLDQYTGRKLQSSTPKAKRGVSE